MARLLRHSTLVSFLALVALLSSAVGPMPAAVVRAEPNDTAQPAVRIFTDDRLAAPGDQSAAQPSAAAVTVLRAQTSGPLAAAAQLEWTVSGGEALDVQRDVVRLSQTIRGWPVFGAGLALQVEDGAVRTASGAYVVPPLEVAKPVLTAETARRLALAYVRATPPAHADIDQAAEDADHAPRFGDAKARDAQLVYFEPTLFDLNTPLRGAAFRVVVEAADGSEAATVIVDARTGKISLAYSEWHSARNRTVRDANTVTSLSGTVCATEGNVSGTASADCRAAYNNTGATYDYFLNNHGRDSFDDNGAAMIAVVRYGTMPNAFWNGSVTAYGPGFATKDVVAHEWTHAVTEYTAGLIYQGQSGALNESFSDVFGAMVDSDDWEMGEETPIGAIRSLSNPPLHDQPDRMSDFYCMTGDNGGVHYNSGVPNKLAYLLAQGGTFNGVTVAGIGRTDTAAIFYRALVGSLTPTSTFNQLASALVSSANVLFGVNSVKALNTALAVDAVELDEAWPCGGTSVTPDSYEVDNTPAAATPITPNGSIAAGHNFHTAGDDDYHVFTAAAGATYVITTSGLGASADTVLILFASNGSTVLAMNDDYSSGLASRIAYTAESDGPLYVSVSNYSGAGGSGTGYSVGVTSTASNAAADSYEPDSSQAAARRYVVNSGWQSRNFHAAYDDDWILFATEAGSTYQIETSDNGSTTDTLLQLYDGSGVLLAENDDTEAGDGAQLNWVADEDADYAVRVSNYDGAYGATATYGLSIVLIESAVGDEFEPDDDQTQATLLAVGAEYAQEHSLHQPGDHDWIRLDLTASTAYILATDALAVGTDTVLELYNDSGVMIDENDDADGLASELPIVVGATDTTYYALVRNYSPGIGRPEMTYRIQLTESDSSVEVDAQEPDDTAADATLIDAGSAAEPTTLRYNFHQVGDQDWVQFSAQAGTIYLIETTDLATNADTYLTLFGPDGTTSIISDDDGGVGYGSRILWQAPSSDTYYARARNFFWSVAGAETGYTLAFSATDGTLSADDYENDNTADAASQLTVDSDGQVHTFHVAGDEDWVAFTAAAATSYELTTDQLGVRADTVLELYASDGLTLVARNDDASHGTYASRIQWHATDGGSYLLRVLPYGSWNTGPDSGYRLRVVRAGDIYEPDDTAETATAIVIGAAAQQHNFTAGDIDWLVFTAQTGLSYRISTSALGSCSDTVLDLYRADAPALSIASNDDYAGLASQIVWTADANDELLIRVRHYSAGTGGACATYAVAVTAATLPAGDAFETDDTRAAASQLTVGSDQLHSLHRAGDVDWVALSVSAGTSYVVETRGLAPCTDTVLTLYSAGGTQLIQNDDYAWPSLGSRLRWTADASGTVYLSVRDYWPTHGGADCTYTLRATAAAVGGPDAYEVDDTYAAANSALVVDGAAQARSFHAARDSDWIALTTVAGTQYSVTTQNLGDGADTVLRLYRLDNSGVPQQILENDDDWSLPDNYASRISWTAAAGEEYLIEVLPWNASGGRDGSTYEIVATSAGAASAAAVVPADGRLQLTTVAGDGVARVGDDVTIVVSASGAADAYKLAVDDKYDGVELLAVEPLNSSGAAIAASVGGDWSAGRADGSQQFAVYHERVGGQVTPLVRLRVRISGSADGKYARLPISVTGLAADGTSWNAGSQIVTLPLAGDIKLEEVNPTEVTLEGQPEVILRVSGLGATLPKVYLVDTVTQAVQQVADVRFVSGSTESLLLTMDRGIKSGRYKVRVVAGDETEISSQTLRLNAPDYRLFVPLAGR